jgi:hypothetical protein
MTRSRAAAAMAALLITAAIPAFAQSTGGHQPSTSVPDATSQQPQLSDAMVHKVGTALRHVAAIRQQYAQRVQSADSEQQRQLSDQAHKEMEKAIGDQGLTVDQYSKAIQMAQADATLRQRLVSAAQSGD